MSNQPHYLSRRQFIKAGTCGSMTIGPLVNSIAQLSLINAASAEPYDATTYKAIVCLFLSGGCDANNIIIPTGSNPLAQVYTNDRGVIAIPNGTGSGEDSTIPLTLPDQESFGLHPALTNVAAMFSGASSPSNEPELAFITNVGTLAEPTSKNTYSTSSLPKQLFSHSDQTTQWMSSIADQPYTSGWGARVAELYNDTWNSDSQVSMMITAAGNNRFMSGGSVNQYTVTPTGAIYLNGYGTNYSNAINDSGGYATNAQGSRLQSLERIMQYSQAHILDQGYNNLVTNARANEERVNQAIEAESALNMDQSFDQVFSAYGASGDLADELKSVLRMIAGRESLGNNRQIFFVDMGGYDHHSDLILRQNALLNELDAAVGAYNQCLKNMAEADSAFEYNQVTTFQASDFNRTFTPNSSGSDHAWGTHTFVFGGAVNGGQFYGTFPELGVNSANTAENDSRGRYIPTTSVDQYSAVIAKWFGASDMETIFPNLYRFDSPFTSGNGTNLAFLKDVDYNL